MKTLVTPLAPAILAFLTLAAGCAGTSENSQPTVSRASAITESAAPATASTMPAADPTALPLPAESSVGVAPIEGLDVPSAEAANATLDPSALSTAAAAAERAAAKNMTPGAFRKQIEHANALLDVNPRDARAHLERAKAYSNLGNYKAAKPDYQAVIRTVRGNPDAYYNKAVNELMLGEYKAASNDFSGALKFRSDDKESYFGRGVAKMQMHQYKPAVTDFTRAIAIDSVYADAYEYRGISYASYDRIHEARRDLTKAARLNPAAAKSLRRYGKGNSLVRGGNK